MATITNTFTKDSITVTNTFDVAARGPVGPTGPVGVTALSSLSTVGYSSPNMIRIAAAGGLEQRTPAQVLSDVGALPASGTAVSATKLATVRTIAGQPFDGTANVSISAANVGAVATTGNETVAGSKTLSGQLQLTGQVASDANSAMTVGMAFPLRPALRGTAWDFVTGGFPAQLGPLAAIGGYYGAAFGPILTSVYPSAPVLAGNIIYWLSVTYGLALMCDKTGVDKSNAVGAWFGSNGSPANFYPNPFTAPPSKVVRVMRLIIPTSFHRTGRRYGLTSVSTYSNQTLFYPGAIWLRFSSTSNALECLVCTADPSTFAAVQTASGAVGSGLTGTFTAYSISDSTRDILVRETGVGATTTIEIAPYSSSPVWSTVLSITSVGFALLAPSVCCDGTNSGAANNYDQALVINECWEAAKL